MGNIRAQAVNFSHLSAGRGHEQVRSPLSNIMNMEGGSGDNAEDDKDEKEASDPQPKRMVDFE